MEKNEEVMQILKMVEEKKITSKEAKELLDALNENIEDDAVSKQTKAKWLRVKVYDGNGKSKANVNLPLKLLNVGLKIATKFAPDLDKKDLEGINLEEIMDMIKDGAEGKIVEVEDQESNNTVEIYVE